MCGTYHRCRKAFSGLRYTAMTTTWNRLPVECTGGQGTLQPWLGKRHPRICGQDSEEDERQHGMPESQTGLVRPRMVRKAWILKFKRGRGRTTVHVDDKKDMIGTMHGD